LILADASTDVAAAARSLAERLCEVGAVGVAHDLLVAVDNDIEDGKVLKTLAVHDNRLYYGRMVIGSLP
jgi:hypothetical protein